LKNYLDACLLSNNVNDYVFVAQGKTTIPGVDDGEELTATDVSPKYLRTLPAFICITVIPWLPAKFFMQNRSIPK
jgi:hypothetical protein